jgi:membrane protein
MKLRVFYKCFIDAYKAMIKHDGIEHAGSLAFLGLLSFFPFLVFFISVAGVFGKSSNVAEYISELVKQFPPEFVQIFLIPRATEILSGPPQGLLTVSIIGVLWTSSSAVEGVRTILNKAYRVKTPPAFLYRRLISVIQVIFLVLFSIIAMFSMILVPIIWSRGLEFLGLQNDPVKEMIGYIQFIFPASLLFLTIGFSYYILPNIKQSFVRVFPGTVVTVILLISCARIFSVYLANFSQVNLIYGSLGGIIATLLFFYISAIIYIYGAEFNYFFERALGHKIVQKEAVND